MASSPTPSDLPLALELELIDAATTGDAARCAQLVRDGADPCKNAQPEGLSNALVAAASRGHAGALRAMLEAAGERSVPMTVDEPVGSLRASPLQWWRAAHHGLRRRTPCPRCRKRPATTAWR